MDNLLIQKHATTKMLHPDFLVGVNWDQPDDRKEATDTPNNDVVAELRVTVKNHFSGFADPDELRLSLRPQGVHREAIKSL